MTEVVLQMHWWIWYKLWWYLCVAVASSTQLQYLGYPIPAVGQSAPSAQQLLNLLPFEISINIPKYIIHWNPNPEVGWWDSVHYSPCHVCSMLCSSFNSKLPSCVPCSLSKFIICIFVVSECMIKSRVQRHGKQKVCQRFHMIQKLTKFYFNPPRPSHMLLSRLVCALDSRLSFRIQLNRGEHHKREWLVQVLFYDQWDADFLLKNQSCYLNYSWWLHMTTENIWL